MGIVARQGIKGMIVTYIGTIVGAINVLWLFPKFLTISEIGLTRVIIDIGLVMAALCQFGAPNIIDRFFSFFKDEQKKHQGFFLLLVIYPLLGFLLIGSLSLLLKDLWVSAFAKNSPLMLDYFYHAIFLAFFILYVNVFEAYVRIHFRIVIPIFIREIFLRVFLSVIVILYHFKIITLDHLIILIIVSYACAVLLLLVYIKNLKMFFINYKDILINKALFQKMMFFGLFIFIGGAWGLIASKADVFMVTSMKNLGNAGIYSTAFFIGTMIEIPRRAISQISTPFISQSFKNNDMLSIRNLYFKTSLNQLIAGLFLFVLIWVNIDFLLSVIPNGESFKAGKYVILFIGMGRLTDMATGINSEIINISPYYKFNLILVLFSTFLLVTVNYLLIPVYGMNGAAISTLISFVVFNFVKSLFIYIKYKMQPFSLKTLWIILMAVLALFCAIHFPEIKTGKLSPFLNIALRSVLVSMLFLGPVIYFKISEDLELLLKEIVKKIKR